MYITVLKLKVHCHVKFLDCQVKINLTGHFVLALEIFSWSPNLYFSKSRGHL